MDIRQQLATSIQKSVKNLTGLELEPQVVVSSDLSKGDLSSNIAMVAFGKIKNNKPASPAGGSNLPTSLKLRWASKTPVQLAQEIVKNLELITNNSELFDRIEVAAPGFINFWLSQAVIIKQIDQVLNNWQYNRDQKGSVQILEFGDLNPFKEPHIGHLRNLALGESLARLLEFQGKKLIRANYEGDVGMHVAKALWGLLQNQKSKIKNQNLDEGVLEERINLLAKSYAAGAKAFEEDEDAKAEIISINNKIYSNNAEIKEIWEKGRRWSLDYFEILYKRLGIRYEKYYFESEVAPVGLKIVKDNVGKVFEKHDGALIFRGEKVGLHTRVFVTKENYATYEGKDLALAVTKNKDFPDIDQSIIMTANEQTEYFKVMFAALKLIDTKIAGKTSHLSFGFVNLKEGKMSSRTGNIVSAFWLLDETKKRLKKGFKEVSEEVLEELSVGSVKWAMLKFSRESNIAFSIEESVQIEGNSGPYMQYAYARTQSLLSKSPKTTFEANSVKNWEQEMLALARVICQFETVTKDAANNFSPNILCNYLYDLAQNFNAFYEKEKVIGSEKEEEKLVVVNAVGVVLKKGLYLLGIDSPKKI